MKLLRIACWFIPCLLLSVNVYSQNFSTDTFGKGLTLSARDSSFFVKFGFRFQTLYIGDYNLQTDLYSDRFLTRRARLKFDGFVYNPRVVYKVELAISNRDHSSGQIPESGNTANIVLDAVVKWNFTGNWEIWFGQTKLPGNRERVISSQKLQFVDRSFVNARFNIDRDLGIQLRDKKKIGKTVITQAYAISMGEGRNIIVANPGRGHQYTGRIEILPNGEFTSKGDYFGSDLARETTPKLSLGVTADYNKDAVRSRGNLGGFNRDGSGNYIDNDLITFFGDLMFKYKGYSVMSEFAHRSSTSNANGQFGTGNGFVIQNGYLFSNNWEVAGRYTIINSGKNSSIRDLKEYTVGISKYVVDHSLKVQSDLSYIDNKASNDRLTYRLQVEVAF